MVRPKVMVVEDEWIIANDIKASLEGLGYSVPSLVSTAEEAIAAAKLKKTDLVLMDIILQGEIDGIEAAKTIIAKYDIPVIFLTAYTDSEILKQAKKSGAYGYLIKPFKERELEATIEMALYKHKMEKNLQQEIKVRKVAEKKMLDYQKQLQSLSSQLSLIEENEKRRIATELHDCIGQTLALSKIKLGLLNKSVTSPELKKIIKEILHLIEQTIRETRTLTFELSPPILYELGLSQAVKWLIDQFREKHGLKIELEDNGTDKAFDNNTRFFLFQAIRELLVNIVKHSRATNVKISMFGNAKELHITVEDDGIGFSESSLSYDGYGLFNIRERMNHINGRFEIKSLPRKGTRVSLVAPFNFDKKSDKKELV